MKRIDLLEHPQRRKHGTAQRPWTIAKESSTAWPAVTTEPTFAPQQICGDGLGNWRCVG